MKKNVSKTHKKSHKTKIIKKIVKKISKLKLKFKIKTRPKVKPKVKSKAKVLPLTKIKAKKIDVHHNKAVSVPLLARSKSIFGPLNVKPYQPKKNEKYMSEKQLEHFRAVLLQWKSQLMAEVDRTMQHMQEEVANYPDPIDRASQEEEFSLELRARDRERKLLRKIEEALNRINDHDYGYCDDCGAEIGIRRLEARPTATQCIECKTISEIREKQVGEGGLFE